MTGEQPAGPDKAEGPLSRIVDGVKLPAATAGEIVSEIADRAPLYGLSGAILAVGLVTGRRALARTGASMLTSQIIAALARAATDRLLPLEPKAKETPAAPDAVPTEPKPVAPAPAGRAAPVTERSPTKVASGALLGVAAAVGGGWLLSRMLKRRPTEGAETP